MLNRQGTFDPRPVLEPNQMIDVSPRDTDKYRCTGDYLMVCDVGPAWATCRCTQNRIF